MNNFKNRQTRIIHNEVHYHVPITEWNKLCLNCKKAFHKWYYRRLLHVPHQDRLPYELFELEIEKEATLDLWKYLREMLHYSRSDADRDEIYNMLDDVFSSLNDIAERLTKKAKEIHFTMKEYRF